MKYVLSKKKEYIYIYIYYVCDYSIDNKFECETSKCPFFFWATNL